MATCRLFKREGVLLCGKQQSTGFEPLRYINLDAIHAKTFKKEVNYLFSFKAVI